MQTVICSDKTTVAVKNECFLQPLSFNKCRLLLLLMTRSVHRAVRTPASAGGPAFFLITDKPREYRCNHQKQNGTNNNCCHIFRNPSEHFYSSCLSDLLYYLVSLTDFVSFVDSLYGLKSIYSINARITTANIKPITCTFPVKSSPNWLIIKETAYANKH